MVDIPVGARVECRDGRGGTCAAVIVNPQTRTVASVVVRDMTEYPSIERVVPADRIAGTTPDCITLDCTQAELRAMNRFVEIHYVPHGKTPERAAYLPAMYSDKEIAGYAVETEQLQLGELAIHHGAQVVATDGVIGTVDELLISPSTGAITHIVVGSRHRLRKQELAVPVSAIDTVADDTVHLKLDRRAVGRLPPVPVRRAPALTRMVAGTTELVLMLCDGQEMAEVALRALQREEQNAGKLVRAAVVAEKNVAGQLWHREIGGVSAGQGAKFGAAAGALLSLLGPVGLLAGAIAGGVTGGLAAKAIDSGVPSASLRGIAPLIKDGGSALLLQVEQARLDHVLNILAGFGGTIEHRPITDDLVRQTLADIESTSVE